MTDMTFNKACRLTCGVTDHIMHQHVQPPFDISCIDVISSPLSIMLLHNKLLRKRIDLCYSRSVIRRKVEHMLRIRRLVSSTRILKITLTNTDLIILSWSHHQRLSADQLLSEPALS
jgi:hypothetical protein